MAEVTRLSTISFDKTLQQYDHANSSYVKATLHAARISMGGCNQDRAENRRRLQSLDTWGGSFVLTASWRQRVEAVKLGLTTEGKVMKV
jgi:hypothetical protein